MFSKIASCVSRMIGRSKTQEEKDKNLLENYHLWIESMEKCAHSKEAFTSKFENEIIFAEATCICPPLKITAFHKKLILEKTSEPTQDTCAICLETIKGEHRKPIVCDHRFHTKCIRDTIKHNDESGIVTKCPLCRQGPCTNFKEIIEYKNQLWQESDSDSDDYDSY